MPHISEFLEEADGGFSATRLGLLAWLFGVLAAWVAASTRTGAQPIPESVAAVLGILMTGKVVQRSAKSLARRRRHQRANRRRRANGLILKSGLKPMKVSREHIREPRAAFEAVRLLYSWRRQQLSRCSAAGEQDQASIGTLERPSSI